MSPFPSSFFLLFLFPSCLALQEQRARLENQFPKHGERIDALDELPHDELSAKVHAMIANRRQPTALRHSRRSSYGTAYSRLKRPKAFPIQPNGQKSPQLNGSCLLACNPYLTRQSHPGVVYGSSISFPFRPSMSRNRLAFPRPERNLFSKLK